MIICAAADIKGSPLLLPEMKVLEDAISMAIKGHWKKMDWSMTVSYTHLDVYKRQPYRSFRFNISGLDEYFSAVSLVIWWFR